jgi:ankyrin repeat protein
LSFYVNTGNLEKVIDMLDAGANPNSRIVLKSGRLSGNSLSSSRAHKSIEILEILLSHGADPNISTEGHRSPISMVAERYRACVEYEAKPNKQFITDECRGVNAQHYRQIILLFLKFEADPDFIGEEPKPGLPVPFIEVVKSGDLELVKMMVFSGADVNQKDRYGRTPAAISTSSEITSFLLEQGADVTLLTNEGKTQVEYAISRYKNRTLINALVDRGMFNNVNDYSTVFAAVRWGDHELLKKVIALGADINMRPTANKHTPLIEAIFRQDLEAVHILLQNGASPFEKELASNKGRAPLEISKWKGDPVIVSLVESYINKIKH